MTNPAWTHDIDPVAFVVGGFAVRWYGLMYLAGFLLCWTYFRHRAATGRLPIARRDVDPIVVAFVAGAILGGRIGYLVFYRPGYLWDHPWSAFAVWEPGRSFHGGAVGLLLVGLIVFRRYGVPYLALGDAVVVPLLIAQALGRIGNFLNGEVYGRVTSVPWGVVFPKAGDGLPRHPAQLYEAAFALALGGALFAMRDTPRTHGTLLGVMLLSNGSYRLLTEGLREPGFYLGPLTIGQALSVPMLLLGLLLTLRGFRVPA